MKGYIKEFVRAYQSGKTKEAYRLFKENTNSLVSKLHDYDFLGFHIGLRKAGMIAEAEELYVAIEGSSRIDAKEILKSLQFNLYWDIKLLPELFPPMTPEEIERECQKFMKRLKEDKRK